MLYYVICHVRQSKVERIAAVELCLRGQSSEQRYLTSSICQRTGLSAGELIHVLDQCAGRYTRLTSQSSALRGTVLPSGSVSLKARMRVMDLNSEIRLIQFDR